MFNEVQDSIKSRLYDSTSTPFMGSFILSWIFINREYVLIYFGEFENKLCLLEEYSFGAFYYKMWLIPLIIALIYVYVYPWFLKHFFSYTLKKQKERYDLKQEVENKKRLTVEQSREIKAALYKLQDELDKKDEKISFYKNEIEKFENKITDNDIDGGTFSSKVETKEDTTTLGIKHSKDETFFQKFSKEFTKDEMSVLSVIYHSSLSNKSTLQRYIIEIQKYLDMPKAKIEVLLKSLADKDYIVLGGDTGVNFDLTQKGKNKVVEMFDT